MNVHNKSIQAQVLLALIILEETLSYPYQKSEVNNKQQCLISGVLSSLL
jgi:hypothetical protein